MAAGCTIDSPPALRAARRCTWAAMAALLAGAASAAEPERWAVTVDNDALTGGTGDRDYTAGFSIALAGPGARRIAAPNYRALEWLDRKTGAARLHRSERAASAQDGVQIGWLLFTPDDIANAEVIPSDRPYSNIVLLEHSHYGLDEQNRVMYETSFAAGLLGARLAEGLQRKLHRAIGDNEPRGYRHQVSDGGELTARYGFARHALLGQRGGRRDFDAHYTLAASAGFLTEISAGIGLRWGSTASPWWTFARGGPYWSGGAASTFDPRAHGRGDFYGWAAWSVRVRLYNALLQGQWRSSDLTYDAGDLERVLVDAAVGVTKDFGRVQLTYALRYQTPELRAGIGARPFGWAGITVTGSR